MPDAFEHWKDKYDELYEVVKTAIAVHRGHTYRLEVIRSRSNPDHYKI